MRRYIRHPSDIPIEFDLEDSNHWKTERLKDIGAGGLSFSCDRTIEIGSCLHVRIPTVDPSFEVLARVVWCTRRKSDYEIGLEISDSEQAFRTRMVEQICHIEHYKREVLEQEGRQLSGKEAATEWIAKFAAEFPEVEVADSL